MKKVCFIGVVFVVCANLVSAGDWPQWRGPDRTGKATASPKLAEKWDKSGPALVWKSKDIPSGQMGGLGSPVLAEGKVVLYANWATMEKTGLRKIDDQALRQIGWMPKEHRRSRSST